MFIREIEIVLAIIIRNKDILKLMEMYSTIDGKLFLSTI